VKQQNGCMVKSVLVLRRFDQQPIRPYILLSAEIWKIFMVQGGIRKKDVN